MLKIISIILISFLFIGCFGNNNVTKEECKKIGKKFKAKKVLNMRTGEYERRTFCE